MIKNPFVLALISVVLVCIVYMINSKCNDEEINKSNMVKMSVISCGVSLLTYHLLNSGDDLYSPNQVVLTGDPGF
mgnify:CR=1 FL=1